MKTFRNIFILLLAFLFQEGNLQATGVNGAASQIYTITDTTGLMDSIDGQKEYLDVCACRKLRSLRVEYEKTFAGNSFPELEFDAWVNQKEGIFAEDLNYLEYKCKEMWETGADKDRTGATLEAYSPSSKWTEVAVVNLNNYAFQKQWKVTNKFTCTTADKKEDGIKKGADFENFLPNCIDVLDCNSLKSYLKSFIIEHPNLYPEPISELGLKDSQTLDSFYLNALNIYTQIYTNGNFLIHKNNQPYLRFWKTFGWYLDSHINHCSPHYPKEIDYYLSDVFSVYTCFKEIDTPQANPYRSRDSVFISHFENFINHVAEIPHSMKLHRNNWYLKSPQNNAVYTEDFQEFYTDTFLYKGKNAGSLKYSIDSHYSNTYIRVKIVDDSAQGLVFELQCNGYKAYYNMGEIKNIAIHNKLNTSANGSVLVYSGIATMFVHYNFWSHPQYPDLTACPNDFMGQHCTIDVPITLRIYSGNVSKILK